MYLFKDLISGDEMFSDIYKMEDVPDTGGALIKVIGKTVEESSGGIDDSLIGGNASAEGGCDDEGTEVEIKRGCNIVLSHELTETSFDMKSFMVYIKDYVKLVAQKLKEEGREEEIAEFKAQAPACVKILRKNFKNYQFFTGKAMLPEGSLGFLDYEEDGLTPYMLFFKHGLCKEKV